MSKLKLRKGAKARVFLMTKRWDGFSYEHAETGSGLCVCTLLHAVSPRHLAKLDMAPEKIKLTVSPVQIEGSVRVLLQYQSGYLHWRNVETGCWYTFLCGTIPTIRRLLRYWYTKQVEQVVEPNTADAFAHNEDSETVPVWVKVEDATG